MVGNRMYPSEIFLDDTLDYGEYRPGNYDGEFNGLVTATDALRYSLNIPAVMVADRVGVGVFLDRLRGLGLSTLTESPEHYGLGLVLGNCEVRLDELTEAYLTIATFGERRRLRMDCGDVHGPEPERIWPESVAQSLYAMLEQPFPDESHAGLVAGRDSGPSVCWKTGTSTGHHDAWAMVFDTNTVVGVWLGNADGRRSDFLSGASAALPLARTIFRGLPGCETKAAPVLTGLRVVETCAASGLPAGGYCRQRGAAWIAKHQFLNRRCAVHARPGKSHWPADARRWDLSRIEGREEAAADGDDPGRVLKMTSPVAGSVYRLSGGRDGDRIRLETSVSETAAVFWYCDDRFLGVSRPDTPMWLDLEVGEHRVSCLGPNGEMDAVEIRVD